MSDLNPTDMRPVSPRRKSYLWNALMEVVRPERFELPAFWFVAARPTLPNLARGVANRANSASWDNFSQTAFSFFCRHLLHNRSCFPRFALPFRDRTTSRFRSSRRQFIFPGSLGWLR